MTIRLTRPALALVAVPLLVLGLAACSPKSDEARDTPGAQTVTALEWGVAQAKCMREAGHDVKDPTSDQGSVGIALKPGESIEKFSADSETCTKKVTSKFGARPISDEEKKSRKEGEKTDDCLRKEGIEMDGNKAFSSDEIPADVKKKCGLDLPDGSTSVRQ